jgi:hypothetical protein
MAVAQIVNEVQQLVQSHWILISGGATSAYGFFKGGLEVLRVSDDFKERLASKDFEVKATNYKTVIGPDSTDVVKLRTIRFHKKVNKIAVDRRPHLNSTTEINIREFYSVPGRAEFDPHGNFEINFRDDEEPRAHSERSVVLGYKMAEKLEVLFPDQGLDPQWPDPGVRVRDPVGSDLLVIEVHFPRGFQLLKPNNDPLIWVHSITRDGAKSELKNPSRLAVLPRPRSVSVSSGSHDFARSGIQTDFVRVAILKPPKGVGIHVSWKWQKVATAAATVPPIPPAP